MNITPHQSCKDKFCLCKQRYPPKIADSKNNFMLIHKQREGNNLKADINLSFQLPIEIPLLLYKVNKITMATMLL